MDGRLLACALACMTSLGCAAGAGLEGSDTSPVPATTTATSTTAATPPDSTSAADTSTGDDTGEATGSMVTMGTLCGDGVMDPMEDCDDGDLDNTNACTNACKLPACGDLFVQPPETCDDANTDDTDDCTNTCQAATCGDGIVQAGIEACDDANINDGDECSSLCTIPGCGDGVVDMLSEQCDDSNAVNTDACTAACMTAACGDGILYDGVEECDDSNVDGGDGCEADCTITQKFTAVGPQINFPAANLTGWSVCFSATYDTSGPPVGDILVACNKANLMLACRPVGAANFALLAHAPREAVTTVNAETNTPTNANGVGWYFSDALSWGFAKEGDPIDRVSCDFPLDAVHGDLRLCWHTSAGGLNPGYRCGLTELNAAVDWERVVLHAD